MVKAVKFMYFHLGLWLTELVNNTDLLSKLGLADDVIENISVAGWRDNALKELASFK